MRALTALAPADVPDAAMALFAAHWQHQRNPADPDVLADILGAAVVEQASEPAVKARLREVTDGAVARGAFGAPTIFVGDEMFFGNDRLDFVARALQS